MYQWLINYFYPYRADIITLQEVESDQFYNFFLFELAQCGYEGVFSPKSRAKTMNENERKRVDGCAIFFKWVIVAIDSVDKSAAKMNLTTSSANIIQGMTDEGEHLVLITNFHFIIYMQ